MTDSDERYDPPAGEKAGEPVPRGGHPDDPRLFGPEAVAKLRAAFEEVTWLLGRGYPLRTAIRTVGDHHQLAARQRLALQRSACSDAQRASRLARRAPASSLRGAEASIDGFNLIITLEVALSGGLLLRGPEGALRDLAGLRGSYAPIAQTDAAIDRLGAALSGAGAARARFLLDAAVPSSGKLRARILERLAAAPFALEAALVPDPDRLLVGAAGVISSDSVVLDRCAQWIDLAGEILAARAPATRIVDFVPGGVDLAPGGVAPAPRGGAPGS
ncbi:MULTISPECIES: DUF434 domain-containing protein [Sorangium]|uniref:DUF434 domain-containing protein n=1 Tax=Sorangium cellulosum TaxID=56 RepID=A0A4P2R266_SORCE|nr:MULTISPECIES: DUF434 domain-containing protein [Sorangium]AUX36661.1 hypothetical protein SOCE836_088690 [Sorangium cellulosum]WCQ95959.1 hypothetical protein NQZ70_08736 [Sorangium sp. Soce836]